MGFSRSNQDGVSLIEAMIASAVVGVVAVGTASIGSYLMNQSRRAQLLNRAVTLQNMVISALLDRSQYQKGGSNTAARDALIEKMRLGLPPDGFELTTLPGGQGQPIARLGSRVGFKIDGPSCDPDDDACPLAVEAHMKCGDVKVSGCVAAYRVIIKRNQEGMVAPAALGAPNTAPSLPFHAPVIFDPNHDYSLRIPHDFFTLVQAPSTCLDSTGANVGVLMTGFHRATGAVSCVNTTVEACADNEIGFGIFAKKDSNDIWRLNLRCHPFALVKCPANYLLQDFDFRQLDQGPGTTATQAPNLSGRCVYRWRNNIDFQKLWPQQSTSTNTTITMKPCNAAVYKVDPNYQCRAVIDLNIPNTACPTYDSVPGPNNTSITRRGPDRTARSTASVKGSINPDTNLLTCTLTVQHDCGSQMTAHSDWTGKCLVREADRNKDLVYPPEPNGRLSP